MFRGHLTLKEATTRWRSDAEKRTSAFHFAPEILATTVQEAVAVKTPTAARRSTGSRLSGKVITQQSANSVVPRYPALKKVRTESTMADTESSCVLSAMQEAHEGFLALNDALLRAHVRSVAEALNAKGLVTPTEFRLLIDLEDFSGFLRAYQILTESSNVSIFLRCLRSKCLRGRQSSTMP